MIKHKELLRGDEEQLKKQAAGEEAEKTLTEQKAKESRSASQATVSGTADAKDLERGGGDVQGSLREEIELDKIR